MKWRRKKPKSTDLVIAAEQALEEQARQARRAWWTTSLNLVQAERHTNLSRDELQELVDYGRRLDDRGVLASDIQDLRGTIRRPDLSGRIAQTRI